MTEKKNNIKCTVDTCDYNNNKEGTCILENVSISCTCPGDCCHDTKETICQSFETTASPITDNEYEVASETIEIEKEAF